MRTYNVIGFTEISHVSVATRRENFRFETIEKTMVTRRERMFKMKKSNIKNPTGVQASSSAVYDVKLDVFKVAQQNIF